jgi:hypothetical protein
MRYKFSKTSGTGGNGRCNGPEVVQGSLGVAVKANAALGDVTKGVLEVGEEATAAREGNLHAAELPEEAVPSFEWHTAATADFGNDGEETFTPVGRELESHADGVKIPSQEGLEGGPAGVALVQFFYGDGFAAGRVRRSVGAENLIDGVE